MRLGANVEESLTMEVVMRTATLNFFGLLGTLVLAGCGAAEQGNVRSQQGQSSDSLSADAALAGRKSSPSLISSGSGLNGALDFSFTDGSGLLTPMTFEDEVLLNG